MQCAKSGVYISPAVRTFDTQTIAVDSAPSQVLVSWREYEVAILSCALKVYSDNWEPDAIVCLGPDGFYFGDALSRLFKKTMGVKMVSQCFEEKEGTQNRPKVLGELSIVLKELQGNVLLVNSLGGDTLTEMASLLREEHPALTEIKTMSVYSKTSSEFFLPLTLFNRFDLQQMPKDLLAQIPESHYPALAQKMLQDLSDKPKEMLSKDSYIDLPLEILNQTSWEDNNSIPVDEYMNIEWNDYMVSFLSLALKIYKDWQFDSILCIGRGGLYVGEVLARIFRIALGVTMGSSYTDEEHMQTFLRIADHISIVGGRPLHGRTLVIDDLVDSGNTVREIVKWILANFFGITEVKTAVVCRKTETAFEPDYFGEEVDAGRWIFLPNEIFDRFDLKSLPKELLAKLSEEQLLSLAQKMMGNLPECPAENLPASRHLELAQEVSNA